MSERVHRVTIELDNDTYRKLVEKAEAEGYTMLKDYILYIIKKSLEEIPVDAESIFTKLKTKIMRLVQDEVNKYSSILTEVRNQIADLYEKIDSLNKIIEELKKTEQTPVIKQKTMKKTGIERLREEKIVFESNLPKYIQGDRFFKYLEREGAIILPLKERVAIDPSYWSLFKRIVFEELSSDDEEEIREKLGKPGYELFIKLRDETLIYYDPKKKKWFPVSKDYLK